MLLCWIGICATYIRFRHAYITQGIQVVEAAKSPLQPALAWYGLVSSVVLGDFLSILNHADDGSLFAGLFGFYST